MSAVNGPRSRRERSSIAVLRRGPFAALEPELNTADQREVFERQVLLEQTTGYKLPRLLMRVQLEVQCSTPQEANKYLSTIEAELPHATVLGLPMHLAGAYYRTGNTEAALRWCDKALTEDAEDWHAWGLIATIHFDAQQWDQAFDAALESLSLVYYQPNLHYLAGRALMRLGRHGEAETELRVALAQMPALLQACDALAELYDGPLGRPADAALMRFRGREAQARRRAAPDDRPSIAAADDTRGEHGNHLHEKRDCPEP
jgi:tetratricopeptide (TPR) repeat protein